MTKVTKVQEISRVQVKERIHMVKAEEEEGSVEAEEDSIDIINLLHIKVRKEKVIVRKVKEKVHMVRVHIMHKVKEKVSRVKASIQ